MSAVSGSLRILSMEASSIAFISSTLASARSRVQQQTLLLPELLQIQDVQPVKQCQQS
ncbi:hypothetical protein HanHA300_Chr02g0061971 [Helianthus annuus]|nr:hypothetical protein HanHA300_Chr02g0061971 [Helianthus annuus]KAJ0619360.1 hypothetical protein HanHA89_Chr02g0070481 [Helianthus annuus]